MDDDFRLKLVSKIKRDKDNNKIILEETSNNNNISLEEYDEEKIKKIISEKEDLFKRFILMEPIDDTIKDKIDAKKRIMNCMDFIKTINDTTILYKELGYQYVLVHGENMDKKLFDEFQVIDEELTTGINFINNVCYKDLTTSLESIDLVAEIDYIAIDVMCREITKYIIVNFFDDKKKKILEKLRENYNE